MIPRNLSHQQTVVLIYLSRQEQWSKDLQKLLRAHGFGATRSSFYELMQRMESIGYLASEYRNRVGLNGKIRNQSVYTILPPGIAVVRAVTAFYSQALAEFTDGNES